MRLRAAGVRMTVPLKHTISNHTSMCKPHDILTVKENILPKIWSMSRHANCRKARITDFIHKHLVMSLGIILLINIIQVNENNCNQLRKG